MIRLIFILFIIIITNIYAKNITAIPTKINYNLEKALLGKKLFNEKMLSIDSSISCATCHLLDQGGDDNLSVSIGVNGHKGTLNSPTVLNAVFNFRQFWDGRSKNLQDQAKKPIENPIEMAHNFTNLIKILNNTKYKNEFKKFYKNGITSDNIANAIAEYEKTLITPGSRFDKFLNGDLNAINEFEKDGYELFKNKGCIACHHGINIGGNLYNKFGVIIDIDSKNLGRYNVTKDERDKYYFKVPTLRNIELTAPYFHDGRYNDLRKTVETMSLIQLGRPISKLEIDKIIAFLKTLTGKLNIIE